MAWVVTPVVPQSVLAPTMDQTPRRSEFNERDIQQVSFPWKRLGKVKRGKWMPGQDGQYIFHEGIVLTFATIDAMRYQSRVKAEKSRRSLRGQGKGHSS